MNRHPRDPRDPFNDPFNDSFFKQFEQIHQHIFRDFFGDTPSIFIEYPNSSQEHKTPDLSQVNPNAPPSNNKDKHKYAKDNGVPSMFRMFQHFFEPEYDEYRLSDINPNIRENGPIMKDDNDNKGLVHPDSHPPGFRSPYLPHSNGAEKNMEFSNNDGHKSFYRSQSVVISTGPGGKTTKTTTIRDSNGETTTTTEQYNNDTHDYRSDIPSIFGFNNNNHNESNDNEIEWIPGQRVPLFERTHDPLERFRSKWQNWKWNPYNWNKNEDEENNRVDDNAYVRKENEGIKWRPYRDYKTDNNKGPSLLDDIVKKKD